MTEQQAFGQAAVCIQIPTYGIVFYDTFSRTTTAPPFAVGVSDSGHQWYWSDFDTSYTEETSPLYVDGSVLAFPTPGTSEYDTLALHGVGTLGYGEVLFDFWVGAVLDETPQQIHWRDNYWGIALTDNNTEYSFWAIGSEGGAYLPVTRSAWHTVRVIVDSSNIDGEYVKGHVWKVGDAEPETWSVLQTWWPEDHSNADMPLLDIYYSASSETTKIDNIYIVSNKAFTIYNQAPAQALALLNQGWGFGQATAYVWAVGYVQCGQAEVCIITPDVPVFAQAQALIMPRNGLLAGIGYPIPYYYYEGPFLPDSWYSETGPNQPNYGEDRGYPPGWSTNDSWSMRWYGRFVADETGEWAFASSTDDGSRIDIYTESARNLVGVVDNNLYGGQGETWREGTIYLTEGQSYFLLARAIQGSGGWRFRFWYKKPSYGDWEYLTDNSAPWIDLGIKRKSAQAEVYTVYVNPDTGAIIDFRTGQAQAQISAFDQNVSGQALVGITREPYEPTPNFGLYLNQGNETYSIITEAGWPNFPSPAMPNNYEWWAKGTFVADVTGEWEFQLLADYRAVISIDAVPILDAYSNNYTISTTVALEAGTRYTLDLYWYGDSAINGLQAWYKRPGEWVWNYLTDANPPWTPVYFDVVIYAQAQAHIAAFDVSNWGQAEALLNTGFGIANARTLITKPTLFYDTFTRTTSAPPFAIGVSDSGHQWYWSDYDTQFSEETSVLYADGSALAMPTPGDSTWDSLALRGTGTTVLGEVQFDFWVGAVLDTVPQEIHWVDAKWRVVLEDNGSEYILRGNHTDYWSVTRSAWHTVRVLIDANDPDEHFVKGHIWKVGDDEPEDWGTLQDIWPNGTSAWDYPILDIYQSSASETTKIDNIYIRGTSTKSTYSQALASIKRTYPRPYSGTLQGSLIVRPIFDVAKTGYIYYTSGSTGWNLVDEIVLNTNDWYGCRYEGTLSYISHQFSETNLTIDVVIDSVVFTVNITAPAPTFGHDFQERDPDTGSRYTLFSLGQGDDGDYSSSELAVRPWDSEPWTLRDINQLQFGAATNFPHSFQGLQVRQIYATITWHYPTEGPFGLALTTVKTTYKALGQSRVQIGQWQFGFACVYIYQPLCFGQAQTSIQTFDNVAVAQAAVYMHEYPSAQAQAQIKQEYFQFANTLSLLNTGFGLAQVQADVVVTYYSSGQARPWIKQTVQSNAQAQTIIRIRYKTFAQARVVIVTQRNSIGQAMVYIGFHQFSQAQARVIAFGVPKFGLARGYIAVGQLPIEPSSDYPMYLVRFNNYDLPGYAQSESYDSVMNTSTHPAPYVDGSLSEYTGLANKTISLKMLLWEKTYLDCKNKLKLAATIFRMSKGFSPLYIQHYDRHYLAIAKSMQASKSVPESVRILGYDIEFEAKPWLVSNMSYSVSGTGTVETTGRTMADGGWTPTIITVSGTDVEITGITADGQSTGVIELTGTVSNLVIDTEAFTALQGTTNMGGSINKDFSMYVGPGVTTFSIIGATSCTIVWGNRWYL